MVLQDSGGNSRFFALVDGARRDRDSRIGDVCITGNARQRFADAVGRFRNSKELITRLDEVFARKSLDEWTAALAGPRLIRAPVRPVAEATTTAILTRRPAAK